MAIEWFVGKDGNFYKAIHPNFILKTSDPNSRADIRLSKGTIEELDLLHLNVQHFGLKFLRELVEKLDLPEEIDTPHFLTRTFFTDKFEGLEDKCLGLYEFRSRQVAGDEKVHFGPYFETQGLIQIENVQTLEDDVIGAILEAPSYTSRPYILRDGQVLKVSLDKFERFNLNFGKNPDNFSSKRTLRFFPLKDETRKANPKGSFVLYAQGITDCFTDEMEIKFREGFTYDFSKSVNPRDSEKKPYLESMDKERPGEAFMKMRGLYKVTFERQEDKLVIENHGPEALPIDLRKNKEN